MYLLLRKAGKDDFVFLTAETELRTAKTALRIASKEFDVVLVEVIGETYRSFEDEKEIRREVTFTEKANG